MPLLCLFRKALRRRGLVSGGGIQHTAYSSTGILLTLLIAESTACIFDILGDMEIRIVFQEQTNDRLTTRMYASHADTKIDDRLFFGSTQRRGGRSAGEIACLRRLFTRSSTYTQQGGAMVPNSRSIPGTTAVVCIYLYKISRNRKPNRVSLILLILLFIGCTIHTINQSTLLN